MGYSSCIAHQVGSRFIQLRQEYLDICGGNHPASIVLAIMEHWANFRISRDLRAQRENEQREIGGLAPLPADGGWVYMSVRQWRDESMGFLSERDVEKALSILMELGFLERRRNPQHKWDRTYQWRLVVSAVNGAIESLPITANAEKDEYKCTYQSGKTAETLPQNSSQNALQNTPEESTLLDAVPPLPAQKHIVGSGEMTDAECQQYVEALPSGAEAMARDAPKDTPGMIEYFRQFGRKRWSTPAERRLWEGTETTVGSEMMLEAVMWAAENRVSRVRAICTCAVRMAREREPPNQRQNGEPVVVSRPTGGVLFNGAEQSHYS